MVILPVTVQSPAKPMKSIGCMAAANVVVRRAAPIRNVGTSRAGLLVDLERPVGDLDEDPVVLDDHRVDGQRQLGRRIERLAAVEVEARQVERAGQRAGRQEALVELEILVAADALDRATGGRSC